MTLGVITATRGTSVHLDATVSSVAALGGPVRHVLVCPAAVSDELVRRFPEASVIAEEEGGLYAALNTGLAQLGGVAAFTWINDDDSLCQRGMARALARLSNEPGMDAIYGRVALMDDRGTRLGELPVAHRAGDLAGLLAEGIMPLAQPGTVVRRAVVDKIGLFDPSYRLAGDLDYFVRALKTGVRFGFVDAELACFRLRADQLSKNEAVVAAEFRRAVADLPCGATIGARWRFRWDNRAVYWERLRRHGLVRMQTLYRHA